MKKYNYLLLLSAVTAATAFTSCDEDKLDIPQKGVASIEDFYKTDDDAESALVSVYADTYDNFAFMGDVTGWNYSPYLGLINWMGDDLILAGSDEGDCVGERELHDFRYTTSNSVVQAGYTLFYRSIHKCNLLLNNMADLSSPVIDRCKAEARVMRAFDHMMLGIYWGTPPIVTEVLTGASQPANCESQEYLMQWVADECDAALPYLEERKDVNDKDGCYKITKGFANAVKGKALMWKKDYSGAKAAFEQVINSNKYALVPSEDMCKIGHCNGKGSPEIVFEFNVVGSTTVNNLGNRQMGNFPYTFNWRFEFLGDGPKADKRLNNSGWGWINPDKKWAEDLIANDGLESARRKAWILTYDELLYNIVWPSDGNFADYDDIATNFVPGRTDAKATDKGRGVSKEYYGNGGYFCWRTVMHEKGDNLNFSWCGTWNANFTIMRYAEVLLLYAEACAQLGETSGKGLEVLNMIQNRAKSAHVSSSLSLAEVKNEKRFEMWQDGCRFADLVRWNDLETLKTADHVIYILDDALRLGQASEHKAVVKVDAGSTFKSKGAGFQVGKHELLPFPQTVVDLNKALKQNPGW